MCIIKHQPISLNIALFSLSHVAASDFILNYFVPQLFACLYQNVKHNAPLLLIDPSMHY